jgi:dihydrofolate reductase
MPGRLIASSICSVDGYAVDADGSFAWAAPDAEVHAHVNALERPIGTYLYGRRMYDTLKVWQTMTGDEPEIRDYAAIWQAADKVVYSTTLAEAETPRTRIERTFDPDAVRALKAAAVRDISIGGPTLAAHAFRAGLVDEVQLFLIPIAVGGGTPALPAGVRVGLRLEEQRRFAGGTVLLRYAVDTGAAA